jgi:hypothetical protein
MFAQRGHDWQHFFKYVELLRMQSEAGTLFLKGPGLEAPLLDHSMWQVEPADRNAGLQLADVVASSFYQAANSAAPTFDVEPAKELGPIIPQRNGSAAKMGVTLFPLAHQATVPKPAAEIFKHYGYAI